MKKIFEADIHTNPGIPKDILDEIKTLYSKELIPNRIKELGNNLNTIELNNKISKIEKAHLNEIKALYKKIIYDYYGTILDGIKLDAKFNWEDNEIKKMFNKTRKESNKQQEFKREIKKLDSDVVSAINKRKLINAITQGEAINSAGLIYIYKDDLIKIDKDLYDLYAYVFKASEIISWMIPVDMYAQLANEYIEVLSMVETQWDNINNDSEKIANEIIKDLNNKELDLNSNEIENKVEELKETGTNPTIKVRAANLVTMIHETIKGIYELISLQGAIEDEEKANIVMKKTDTIADEVEDLKYGPELAKRVRSYMNSLRGIDSYPNMIEFIYGKLIQLEDNEFLLIMNGILNKSSSIKTKLERMINDILSEIKEGEFGTSKPKEETPKNLNIEKRDWEKMKYNQGELKFYLDKALDSGDFETAKEIGKWIKESKKSEEKSKIVFESLREFRLRTRKNTDF